MSARTDLDPANGRRLGNVAGVMLANQAISLFQSMLAQLAAIQSALDPEPTIDTTYVVGGTLAGPAVIPINLPRGVKHIEVTLSVGTSDATKFAAVFSGNVALADAGNRHNPTAGGSPSGAIVASNGNTATARDYLDETGILTVYFTGAATMYANVRVRVLDKTQSRAQRT